MDVNPANTNPPELSVHSPTFVGMVSTEGHPAHTTEVNPISPGTQPIDPGWHIKLTVGNSPMTWCIDTGAQISVMPETVYQPSFGNLVKRDRKLVGAGDTPLDTTGYADMELSLGNTHIKERVYIVHGATKLLLGIPAIRERGLIHEIPGTYSVRAISCNNPDKPSMPKPNLPSRFANKEDILKEYPTSSRDLVSSRENTR